MEQLRPSHVTEAIIGCGPERPALRSYPSLSKVGRNPFILWMHGQKHWFICGLFAKDPTCSDGINIPLLAQDV